MATYDEIIAAARKADEQGNAEDARRLLEIARERQDIEPAVVRGAAFFNKALAEVAGAPFDVASAAIGKVASVMNVGRAQVQMPEPVLGSEFIKRGMEGVGIPVARREPQSVIEYIGQVGGESGPMLFPMLAASRAASGTSTAGRVLQSVGEEFMRRPVRAAGIEAMGISGAGVGRMVADEGGMSPGGAIATEMAAGAAPQMAMALSPLSLARRGSKALGAWAVFPFTEAGAYERASRRIKSIVDDPIKVAQNIDDLRGTGLLPSAASGNPGLMALENAVLDIDPGEAARIARNTSDTVGKLVDSIRSSGNISDTRKFIAAKRERLFKALDARVELAGDRAAAILNNIAGDEAYASVAVRSALEEALADAKVQEAILWQAIPQDARASTAPVFNKFQEWRGKLSSAQQDDIPEVARRIIGGAIDGRVKQTTIRELDGLYKRLGEDAASARASNQFTKAKIAEELRESILESFDTAEGSPGTKEIIDTARGFSRQLNEKFRRGSVGKILGYSTEGGPALAPELTLGATVGAPGVRGSVALRELSEATQNPQALEGVQSFLKDRFLQASVRDGQVRPELAATFMRNNAEVLASFPALRDQLSAARDAADVARRVQKSSDAMRRALDRQEVSATARIMRAPVDQEIQRLMTSPDPVGMIKEVAKVVRKQGGGEAMAGLKAGFSSWLVDNATSRSAIDIGGRPIVFGVKLKNLIETDKVREAMRAVYAPGEIKRIHDAADILARFQQRSITKSRIPIIEDRPAWLLMIAGRVLGAKAGAAMSTTAGGSIQSAAIGSNAVREFLNKLTADKAQQLIVDAIENPELMTALLRHRPSASNASKRKNEAVIRGWMLGSGSRLLDPETYVLASREEDSASGGINLGRRPSSRATRPRPEAPKSLVNYMMDPEPMGIRR